MNVYLFLPQWVYILDIVHVVLGWCGLSAVDPALTAEVALRLALVFEASAALESSNVAKKSAATRGMKDDASSHNMDMEEQSMMSASAKGTANAVT